MPAKKTRKKIAPTFVISKYFGFDAIDIPHVSKEDILRAKPMKKLDPDYMDSHTPPLEEQLAILRHYKEQEYDKRPQPIMIHHEGQPRGTHKKKKKKADEKMIGLHIIGTPKSIAESMLIKTALAILEDAGYTNTTVTLNNIGDKEAFKEYNKELTAYLRKNINDMNTKCRELFKQGTHSVISCNALSDEMQIGTPDPMTHLTDQSCGHLKEVVEFLEKNEIPYEINKNIIGNPHYASDTIFSIIDTETGQILASGSRYNEIGKKSELKKDIAGASIHIKIKDLKKKSKVKDYKEPVFYYLHAGLEAKHKSLKLIDQLRKEGISVHHSLMRDKISTQMEFANKKGFKYIIIMGHKEALENSVIVRNIKTFEQDIIPVDKLAKHLIKLEKSIK